MRKIKLRPFEEVFPPDKGRRILEESILLSSGRGICSSCGRVVPLWEILREDFTYLLKECPQENFVSLTLLNKGVWEKEKGKYLLNFSPTFNYFLGEEFTGSLLKVSFLEKINTLVLRITNRCNAYCRICADRKEIYGEEVGKEEIERGEVFYNRQIALTGGEPTVNEELPSIMEVLKKRSNLVSLCTNGLKLANLDYLSLLKDSGLDYVLLSFDGFGEELYREIRGDEKQYSLKMKALHNLRKLGLPTILQTTLIKEKNEGDLSRIIELVMENSFIQGVWIKPVFLPGTPPFSGFDSSHLLSLQEIKSLINQSCGISPEYFDLFYLSKYKVIKLLQKLYPYIKVSQPQKNQVLVKKTFEGIKPLLSKREMENLIQGRWSVKYLPWLGFIIKNRLSPLKIEKDLLKRGWKRINIGRSRGPRDIDLSKPVCYLYLIYDKEKGWVASSGSTLITPQD